MSDPHAHATGHAHSELDADEPRTPLWLPLLGGALFLAAAIFLLATSSDEPAAKADAEASPKSAATVAEPADGEAPAPTERRVNVRRVPEENIQRLPPPGQPGAARMVPPGDPAAPRVAPPGNAPRPTPKRPSPAAPPHDEHPHPH